MRRDQGKRLDELLMWSGRHCKETCEAHDIAEKVKIDTAWTYEGTSGTKQIKKA